MGKRGKVLGVLFAAALVMVGNVNAYAASSANWNLYNYLSNFPHFIGFPACPLVK